VLHGIPKSQHRTRAGELLERVGLTAAGDRRVGTYSGGMRRRLDLALSLIHEPSVLFLDEPTTGLDPMSRIALWEEVRRLNGDGTTVLLTTQYLEEADQLAERIAIIDHGRIVRKGRPAELKAEVGFPTLFVTVDRAPRSETRRDPPGVRPAPAHRRARSASGSSAAPAASHRSSAASTRPGSACTTSSSTNRASTTCSPRRPATGSKAPTDDPDEPAA
jgi:ABC-type multidrug transport system ATPase subunit